MRFFFVAILVACIFLSTNVNATAQGAKKQNKGKVANVQETTDKDYAALAGMSKITARLLSADPSSKSILFRVEYQGVQPGGVANRNPNNRNPNFNRNNNRNNNRNFRNNSGNRNLNPQQLMRELQQIERIQNPIQRQQRLAQFMVKVQSLEARQYAQQMQQMQRLAQQMARNAGNQGLPGNLKMVTMAKEFEVSLAKDVHITRANLPVEYDEKGNVKKYTADELKEKRDPKFGGFKAAVEDLAPGQMVTLYLSPPKKANDKNSKEILGDILDAAGTQAGGPTVTAIVILSEADPTFSTQGKNINNKKKKK